MIRNYSDEIVIKGKKSIFLAGPTPRDENTISWRIDVCDRLEKLGFDGVVYNPEYSSWKPKSSDIDQAEWEREALTEATVILFWIPRDLKDMPAFTTNVEFGYWLHTGKIIYGRPDNSVKNKYLDWLYKTDYNKEPFNDLDKLLKESIMMVDELYENTSYEILPLNKRVILKKENAD